MIDDLPDVKVQLWLVCKECGKELPLKSLNKQVVGITRWNHQRSHRLREQKMFETVNAINKADACAAFDDKVLLKNNLFAKNTPTPRQAMNIHPDNYHKILKQKVDKEREWVTVP